MRSRAIGFLLLLIAWPAGAQTSLTFARIPGIPDQFVGSKLLEAIYARLDIKAEFLDVPANRALSMSSAGELDGEVLRILDVAQQYETLLPVKPAINYIEPTAFSKRLQFETSGWQSIAQYRVGIVRGVGSSERGTKDMPQVEPVTSIDTLFNMLDGDRLDVIVNDLFGGRLVAKKLGMDQIVHPLLPPFERLAVYHFLNVKHRDLLPKVEAIVREMEASGELAQLRRSIEQQMLDAKD